MSMVDRIKQKNWILPFLGFLSLVWFLIRVIPKPDRAGYPCQRAAFPLASGFVLWVAGMCTSVLFFRRAQQKMHQARYAAAALSLAVVVVALGFTFLGSPSTPVGAQDEAPFIPEEGANQPMGEGRGIYPGRVAWVHDPNATNWEGDGYWWEDENTDPIIVGEMVSQSLRALTGKSGDAAAWDALFQHFNTRRGKGDVGYQSGEKIAIKLNLNQVGGYGSLQNRSVSGPQMVLAYLRQLVSVVGVADADIVLYDATRYVPGEIMNPVRAEFPNVRFVDWGGGTGREKYARDPDVLVHWSEELVLEDDGGNPTYLPTVVTEAAYIINMGILKAHNLAGVTMCAKNHFGTISADINGRPSSSAPKAAGIHPYATVHDFPGGKGWNFDMRDMGTYNALVDLMGHEHLGEKTLLFIVDGLYATPLQNPPLELSYKWEMAPFNGDWPSSLFVSQDGVAIESVGLDFLRTEPTMTEVYGNVDNYLHEASMAHDSPSGTVYDPEGDGVPLPSLGAHEHWNNPTDMQYSRNLDMDYGIELVTPQMVTAVTDESAGFALPRSMTLRNYPNPFNASTVLAFTLLEGDRMRLEIYNALGQQVALLVDEYLAAGSHEVVWNGRDLRGMEASSGVYFAKLTIGGRQTSRKLLLAR
jgi:hypothetical protein